MKDGKFLITPPTRHTHAELMKNWFRRISKTTDTWRKDKNQKNKKREGRKRIKIKKKKNSENNWFPGFVMVLVVGD